MGLVDKDLIVTSGLPNIGPIRTADEKRAIRRMQHVMAEERHARRELEAAKKAMLAFADLTEKRQNLDPATRLRELTVIASALRTALPHLRKVFPNQCLPGDWHDLGPRYSHTIASQEQVTLAGQTLEVAESQIASLKAVIATAQRQRREEARLKRTTHAPEPDIQRHLCARCGKKEARIDDLCKRCAHAEGILVHGKIGEGR